MGNKQAELNRYIYPGREVNTGSAEIIKAVEELPFPGDKIIREYFFNEKSSREIMLELGITRNKFYKHLNRGKYMLRLQMNPGYYDRANDILYGKH